MKKITVCVVEDNERYIKMLHKALSPYANVKSFLTYKEGAKFLAENDPSILLVDLQLDNNQTGKDILKMVIKKDYPKCVLTSFESDEVISECIDNLGADNYFVKGESFEQVVNFVRKISKKGKLLETIECIPTSSESFRRDIKCILENSHLPCLLMGETGVGKTYLAKSIHEFSQRRGSFVDINCKAISENLFESEMFGHKKGSFSGAFDNHDGKFLEANNGTIFLDEIDSMPMSLQTKLLKVIEDKYFYPVGSTKKVHSNFNLICASREDLIDKVKKGEFREDLFYRISFVPLKIPPLRNRQPDIMQYLKHYLEGSKRYIFSKNAKNALLNHPYYGNLRELKIISEAIEALGKSKVTEEDLSQILMSISTHDADSLSQWQRDTLKHEGLSSLIEKITNMIMREVSSTNSTKVTTELLKKYKINQSKYYRWLKKNEEELHV